jgi:hypothetical protein
MDTDTTVEECPEYGTKDGTGAGDRDQPYVFGRKPRVVAPFPFTSLEFGRLLLLRGQVQDAHLTARARTRRSPGEPIPLAATRRPAA